LNFKRVPQVLEASEQRQRDQGDSAEIWRSEARNISVRADRIQADMDGLVRVLSRDVRKLLCESQLAGNIVVELQGALEKLVAEDPRHGIDAEVQKLVTGQHAEAGERAERSSVLAETGEAHYPGCAQSNARDHCDDTQNAAVHRVPSGIFADAACQASLSPQQKMEREQDLPEQRGVHARAHKPAESTEARGQFDEEEVFTRVRNALADMFEVPAAVQRLTGGLSATPMHPLSPGESPQEAMSDRPGGRSLEDMLQQLQSMMRTREGGFVSAEQSYVLQTELLRQLEELRAAMMMVDIILQDFEVGVVEQRLVRVHDRQRIVQLEQERESLLGLMEKEVSRNIQSTEVQLTALRGSVVKVSERFPF
jgi:hypothetical protein